MNIPTISIEYNLDEEVEQFLKFLHHPLYIQSRKNICRTFPKLEELLGDKKEGEEKKVLREFIQKYRLKRHDRIDNFMRNSQELLSKNAKNVLQELGLLMDYEWSKNFPGYKIVPVILPFTPYNYEKKTWYFSMIRAAQGVEQKDVLLVAVHEISHMIFYDYLRELGINWSAGDDPEKIAYEYLKEILAPVIMNQKSLARYLNLDFYEGGYFGNPDIAFIFVRSSKNGEVLRISRYFQSIYEDLKYKKGESFLEILKVMINLILSIKEELRKKRQLWNQYGLDIFQNDHTHHTFEEPIQILP